MHFSIQPLPPEVIDIIAAGEVIDSLTAVVRELVENAIDAGATRLVVKVDPDLWRVQVADNGQGMTRENLRLCAHPHSTSKIFTCEDLWKITSLGFRGEALHSIAQLSELVILSRVQEEEDVGWQITYNQQGEGVKEEVVAIAPGTVVTVSNLFGNVPVRRRGLPSPPQQLAEVQTLLQQIALCHPGIHWQVWQGEKLWFKISPGINAQEILPQLLRRIQPSDLQFLSLTVDSPEDSDKAQIDLMMGLPDRCHRQRPDWVKVAVNGRFVRSPQLEQTLITAFSRTLPRDRYPLCFLHLTLNPQHIDWNRHPAKTEIYLHHLDFWRQQVSQGVEQALRISPAELGQTAENQRLGQLLKVAESTTPYHLNREIAPPTASPSALHLIPLKAVAQVNQTYIVAEHPHGVWLIEQHIAHERVLYEQLQDAWELMSAESPVILNNLQAKQVEQLERIGLEVEAFGEQMWAVRTVPAPLLPRADCREALLELSWGGDLETAQVATACRSAIRNGTPLSLSEMQALIDQWKVTRHPRTCPHGRPIFLALDESSLVRFFRRHWVIGKSHGI
ncbi:DNA mismatch repair endonuclease MutL [Spirulina subsalsa FACHB-351]|uniref:DNA mismatch repair protein MutL n=1 Tax=Spirulina subsalsa FACHB-351 TaxID=234711 RepID=A0ABT3KZX5_9CYAN|nr:DNA mismatch repair endonuclease MutL [Spirulina subsalsa]MCW6034805.1 DNA mismatch repair endonuclease MutL [Spirulina subsalsa FACHB-351]